MDVREKRSISTTDILPYLKLIKFKSNHIYLMGSSSYKSQRYYSDYDLFSPIKDKLTPENIYNEFVKILKNTFETNSIYFIEFKIQDKNGAKHKIFDEEDITLTIFKKYYEDLDFIKLDFIIHVNNIFTELSIMYSFNQTKPDVDVLIESFKSDFIQYKKDHNYFKALKRKFALLNLKNDADKMLILSKFFNSENGHKYKIVSNLKTIKLLLKHYNTPWIKKMCIINLKDLKIDPPDLDQINNVIHSIEKEINSNAKPLLNI